jgi:DNA-binding winged helix-turn-helix (wHTH) protein/tetratricopeptide (TPR) repeat protein
MRAISLEKKEIYEFGDFRFDLDEHTIERVDGLSVDALPEKTLQILALLIKQRGHLVEKGDILEQIWPDSFVEENNVDKRVSCLRQFLGRTESGGNFIETVRGHGYRFVGRVNVVEVSRQWLPETLRSPDEDRHLDTHNGDGPEINGALLTGETVADVTKPDTSVRKVLIALAAAAAVLTAVVVGYLGFFRGSAAAPRTIVVLPVVPINSADRNVLYEIGIADSLINQLSSVEGFTIRPLSSVRSYADAPMDPISAGREQKVDYVLASNYQIANGRIKVTAQLYNIASGKVDDAFQSQQDIANVFNAQDAIAAEFGTRLIERFNASTIRPTKGRGTNNEEAYRLYQQGMYLIDKRRPENSQKAVDYLAQAVVLDPNYAQAWAGKAEAIWTSGQRDENQIHDAIQKALAIDPSLSDAYSSLCIDKLLYHYDFAGAEAACKQAIDLDPSSSAGHRAYSWVLSFRGDHDGSLAEITTAIDLEPVSYINKRDLGNALYIGRRYEEAAAQWRRVIELDPTDPVVYNQLIRTLEAQGKEAEAFEWFIKLLNVLNRDEQGIAEYKAAYQNSGWRGVLLERAADPNRGFGYGTDFHIACLYAQAGEKDKAFEYLESSFRQREWSMPQLHVYPQLDPIRDDPRFDELARRIETE